MKTSVARDSTGDIMWVRGRTDLSPLTYREWKQGEKMKHGLISKDGRIFSPPFTITEEIVENKKTNHKYLSHGRVAFQYSAGTRPSVDISDGELDVYVDGQKVLRIGQVSDDNVINLFLCPKGKILMSLISGEKPEHPCTHELIATREQKNEE